jgi:hypothetical protein
VDDPANADGLRNISVHSQAVDYDEQGSEEFIDLYRMVDGDGPFKDVRRLRDAKLADVVGLILANPSGYGLRRALGRLRGRLFRCPLRMCRYHDLDGA